jgi:cytochrome c-type biogenesis protein CcmH
MKRFSLALSCAVFAASSWAGEATPTGPNVHVEQRMTAIAAELRCLVCQNESIAGSRADLAVDLRRQIREQIVAGKSDQEIMTYMVDRYGDFVRYRPPLKGSTLLLWFGPALLLAAGLVALALHLRRRSGKVDKAPLSDEDSKRAEALLRQNSDTGKST